MFERNEGKESNNLSRKTQFSLAETSLLGSNWDTQAINVGSKIVLVRMAAHSIAGSYVYPSSRHGSECQYTSSPIFHYLTYQGPATFILGAIPLIPGHSASSVTRADVL